ncbi:MAG: hypothetical protein NTW82_13995 [Bacteroidia bacterium]|nr:hypothetical protein [Bacteroidia bacterium]
MNELEKDAFDWKAFLEKLSDFKDEEEQLMFFSEAREKYKEEIPDFTNQFWSELKDISFQCEREEYYNEPDVYHDDFRQHTFESNFGIPLGELDEFTRYEITTELYQMFKWADNKNHKHFMKMTRLWVDGVDFVETNTQAWSVKDRLFLLRTIVNFRVLPEIDLQNDIKNYSRYCDEFGAGGERLSKLLSIIMNTPATSIEKCLPQMKKYLDFKGLDDSIKKEQERAVAGIWANRLRRITNIFDRLTASAKYSKKSTDISANYSNAKKYLEKLNDAYEYYFGPNEKKK